MNGLTTSERLKLDAIRALASRDLSAAQRQASAWMRANKARRVLREAALNTVRGLRSQAPKHALGLDLAGYWRFLRQVYGMGALEAWGYIKRVGAPPTVGQIRAALEPSS